MSSRTLNEFSTTYSQLQTNIKNSVDSRFALLRALVIDISIQQRPEHLLDICGFIRA